MIKVCSNLSALFSTSFFLGTAVGELHILLDKSNLDLLFTSQFIYPGFQPKGPQHTTPQHLAVFLFLGKIGGSSPVTGRLNTEK